MAAREHQGLQIALIIFVILTIALCVSTFMFSSKLREANGEVAKAKTDKTAAEEARAKAETENGALKPMLGHAEAESIDTITKTFDGVKLRFAALKGGPGAKKPVDGEAPPEAPATDDKTFNYQAIVKALEAHITAQDGKIAQLTLDNEAQKKAVAAARTEGDAAAKKIEETQKTAVANSEKVRTDSEAQVADARKSVTAAEESRKTLETKVAQTEQGANVQTKQLREALAKSNQRGEQLAGEVASSRNDNLEVPDGKVTWVSVESRAVYVNLGHADGLRPQVSFSVHSAEVQDLTKNSKGKAKIEVTKVLGPHEAECRIVEDSISDPILVTDKVYSPVWHPGRQIHFALAGTIDIDGDGGSDLARVIDLITINGGKVDAYENDKGALEGKLSVATRYIVIGTRPTETTGKQVLENYTKLISDSKSYGTQQMNVQQFLDMMGYKADERTIQLGRGADPKDFRARPAAGAARSPITLQPFRERQPGGAIAPKAAKP